MGDDFKILKQRVVDAGLLHRTYVSYVICFALILAGFAVGVSVLFATDSVWVQLCNAVFLAVVMMQMGMLSHDFSHQQVFASRRLNELSAFFAWGFFCGLSEEAWYAKHNAHHKYVNHVTLDPDLTIPFIFSDIQEMHQPSFVKRFVQPYQHLLFFALLPFVYMSFVYGSFHNIVVHRDLKHTLDGFLMTVHFFAFLVVPFLVLPLISAALFIAIFTACVGYYMGFAFAPNHKGKEVLSEDTKVTWRHQIVHTRNLYPSWPQFYFWGGLNYQVEHHLFPTASRFNYPYIQPIVKKFCEEKGIPYHETSWSGSVAEIYRSLKAHRKA